ncbi:MAG TPA: HAMP domain-containing sensor histidine kinase, partial [Pirellulales bacterium]|nr:HAMP domain-containing sensor histidine kinase [Pirellulales bacterium]
MSRPWQIWLTFAGCLAVAVAAVGWLSVKALQADQARAEARHEAAIEENARLALWRMDSFMTPIVAKENARPSFIYNAFYSAQREYGQMGDGDSKAESLIPSPLLFQATPYVLLHWQMNSKKQWTSPEVPAGPFHNRAVPKYLSEQQFRTNSEHLNGLQKTLDTPQLETELPQPVASVESEIKVAEKELLDLQTQLDGVRLALKLPPRVVSLSDASVPDRGSPLGESEVVAWLHVGGLQHWAPPNGLPASSKSNEYQTYRQSQTALIKSPTVLQDALKLDGITDLPLLRAQAEPLRFLEDNIIVVAPLDSELLQIKMRGTDPEQLVKIVNAVKDSYIQHVVQTEGKEDVEKLALLEVAINKKKQELSDIRDQQQMTQGARSFNEYQARAKTFAQNNIAQQDGSANQESTNPANPPAEQAASEAMASVMTPLWLNNKLLLARRVTIAGNEVLQGCLLNWPALKEQMLSDIKDLLPQADLQPVVNLSEDSESHRLASLPVMLIPGALAEVNSPGLSPIRQSLLIAWSALLLTAIAGAIVLQGVITLSERRAAFVSAVTHELRTPLTTFRMYAEMLSEGMVATDAERRQYLDTLRVEADRLTHLVANVLAYARLERGRPGGRVETLSLEKLLAVATQRLSERAAQAQFQLNVESGVDVLACTVRADPAAVEQILFNLVDNACKYAASATDRTLHLSATHDGRQLKISVRDHGPGISSADQRRLFQAFRKSAQEAAHSAPGVGLGLALSRRLAQDMHGDLCYESRSDGACFVLSL